MNRDDRQTDPSAVGVAGIYTTGVTICSPLRAAASFLLHSRKEETSRKGSLAASGELKGGRQLGRDVLV